MWSTYEDSLCARQPGDIRKRLGARHLASHIVVIGYVLRVYGLSILPPVVAWIEGARWSVVSSLVFLIAISMRKLCDKS